MPMVMSVIVAMVTSVIVAMMMMMVMVTSSGKVTVDEVKYKQDDKCQHSHG